MKIGLLQCGATAPELDDDHGSYPELYAALLGDGFDWETWRVFEGRFPDGPEAADGWLISGSRHGAYEGHDWIAPLESLIRDIHNRKPLVGICFGHQIIAQALGGLVENYDGGWSVGRRAYDLNGKTVHLNAWHQDQVTTLPPGARVVARNDFTVHAGLAIGDMTLTLQPHPEFSNDYIRAMIPVRGDGIVPRDILDRAAAETSLPVDNAAIGSWLAKFFRAKVPA